MAEQMKDTFEIICGDATLVTKKMNPIRRALVMEKIVNRMGTITKDDDNKANVSIMAALLKTDLPEVMWAFIKDEHKKDLTYEKFVDEIDDKSSMEFLSWVLSKVQELNSFLENSQKATDKVQ